MSGHLWGKNTHTVQNTHVVLLVVGRVHGGSFLWALIVMEEVGFAKHGRKKQNKGKKEKNLGRQAKKVAAHCKRQQCDNDTPVVNSD